jgi:N-acetylglutamate synthase-like GNAT family acetyltransferase
MRATDATPARVEEYGEKSFYLDEFRRQTLLIAVPGDAVRRPGDTRPLVEATADLWLNATRVVLTWGGPETRADGLGRALRDIGAAAKGRPVPRRFLTAPDGGAGPIGIAFLQRVWGILRESSPVAVRVGSENACLADFAQRLGVRLGVRKLVLLDPQGGISNESGLVSFMDGAMLEELLRRGEAEWAGVGHRRPVLDAVRAALLGGVDSVNLCDLRDVARELFTYEGAGTLFTREDYCRVERLRVDDFLEVERLLERGQREGYLRLRSAAEIAEILMSGYGATIGSGHLAGVCALVTEPYRSARAGEIVGLYTITRFKGEGVGGKLIARALEDARQLGLRYVFACTTHDRARAFFERNGFEQVSGADVPARKWRAYDPARRRGLSVYRFSLAPASRRSGPPPARRPWARRELA